VIRSYDGMNLSEQTWRASPNLQLEYIQSIGPAIFRRWLVSAYFGENREAPNRLGNDLPVILSKQKSKRRFTSSRFFRGNREISLGRPLGIRCELGHTDYRDVRGFIFTLPALKRDWYQKILEARPDGRVGWTMHHGLLDITVRFFVLGWAVCTKEVSINWSSVFQLRSWSRFQASRSSTFRIGSPKGSF